MCKVWTSALVDCHYVKMILLDIFLSWDRLFCRRSLGPHFSLFLLKGISSISKLMCEI